MNIILLGNGRGLAGSRPHTFSYGMLGLSLLEERTVRQKKIEKGAMLEIRFGFYSLGLVGNVPGSARLRGDTAGEASEKGEDEPPPK